MTVRRSSVSALAAEAHMNHAGQVAFSLACTCLQGGHGLHRGEWCLDSYAITLVHGVAPPSSFIPFLTVFSHFLYPPSFLGYNYSLMVAGGGVRER